MGKCKKKGYDEISVKMELAYNGEGAEAEQCPRCSGQWHVVTRSPEAAD